MIVLDTHIWIWWVHESSRLKNSQAKIIEENETDSIGVSAISCWEIAKLVEHGKIELPEFLEQWFNKALNYKGIKLLKLTPSIAVESTRLPGNFHRDPADQIIVATARLFDCHLVTSDHKILEYAHVKTVR